MANEEHVSILKQGPHIWNSWRERNIEIIPDLSGVNIWGMPLSGVNLSRANLWQANLNQADLSSANLRAANLSEASLYKINLTRANLEWANLRGANISEGNLRGTYLMGANLSETFLYGANLSGAKVAWTIFGDIDLAMVKGLDSINHRGPSIIGIDTIYRSEGNISEAFLKGAGVPDDFLTYMKSLVGQAIEFYTCFISFSSKDKEFVERLFSDLRRNGVRCWFAPEDMKIGDDMWDTIDKAIRMRDKVLLILSHNSIESTWVEDEVKKAFAEERNKHQQILFPIRLDDAIFDSQKPWASKIRENRYIGDFRYWQNNEQYEQAFNRLIQDLKVENKQ